MIDVIVMTYNHEEFITQCIRWHIKSKNSPSAFPDISGGKALIEQAVAGKSTRYQERLIKLEQEAAAELKAKQEAEATAKKKTTITCIKGKLTKKVTAVNPKCPKGYVKK